MLRMVLGVSWGDKISNDILNGNLLSWRDTALGILNFWPVISSLGNQRHREGRQKAKRSRPKQSYLSKLIRDVGTKTKEELRTLMRDRDLWRKISAIDRT